MIAIHHNKGSFSDRWIDYCQESDIPFKIVNVYDTDIVSQLNDCDIIMWHYHHGNYKDIIFAKQLLQSLENKGLKVFPDFNTAWHFNDKIGQKYLLESINAPLVPTYIFYSIEDVLRWIKINEFPKVFKLRNGAGSVNVKLIRNKSEAVKISKKAFRKGFNHFDNVSYLKDLINKLYIGSNRISVFKQIIRLFFFKSLDSKLINREIGYVYFQDFLPNPFDLRVIVIGQKAFAIKRLTRENDFRASGSGNIIYNNSEIDIRCVKIAFETSDRLNAQCLAYDFIFDSLQNPLIIEVSYGFDVNAYNKCPGFWDSNLVWHECKFNPQYWIIENLINSKDVNKAQIN